MSESAEVDEGLSAGEVARRLGIAVTTLRTWHQRYGLGPTRHAPGHHRRYGESDIARLETMRRLTGQGVPAAQAARVATGQGTAVDARDGGGRTIALGRSSPAARGLARAAMRLDAPAMLATVTEAVRDLGVAEAWRELLCPVLVSVGERQAETGRMIEVEHLLSRSIQQVLLSTASPPLTDTPRVLLACADEEQHTLAIEALAAALAERGCPSRMLGARVPGQALADAVRRTGPAVVFVWSQTPETGTTDQVRELLDLRPRPIVIAAGGPGWPDELPSGIDNPGTLDDAVDLVLSALA